MPQSLVGSFGVVEPEVGSQPSLQFGHRPVILEVNIFILLRQLFFEPFKFHLQASDLLVQLSFLLLELTHGPVAVALKEPGAFVQQRRLPLADLVSMDATVTAQLGQRLAAPACGPLAGLADSRASLNLYSALYGRRFLDIGLTPPQV